MATAVKKVKAINAHGKPPPYKLDAFCWSIQGFEWRDEMLRAPEGIVAQDLHDHPDLCSTIQRNPALALRLLDHVTVIAADESWLIEAIVDEADLTGVRLAFIRKRGQAERP